MCKSRLLFVISIHAPTRGATFFVAFSLLLYLHFNPRSHEGSDGTDGGSRLNLPISIHAPTRGATTTKERYWIKSMISIHAPTRGATKVCTCKMFCNLNFNPRSHEGSDDKVCPVVLVCDISIHAPTRGATNCAWTIIKMDRFQSALPRGERLHLFPVVLDLHLFQSTLPRGERRIQEQILLPLHLFQSTLPRGERRKCMTFIGLTNDFNPRSHEGSDCNID